MRQEPRVNELPAPDDFALLHPLRVRWAEVDAQHVVFYAQHLAYFDVAFTEYMRAIDVPFQEGLVRLGVDMLTVTATANYRASARYDDELLAGARVSRIGRTSVRFEYALFREGTLLVDGTITYVVVDLASGRPVAVPPLLVERIETFEQVPPER